MNRDDAAEPVDGVGHVPALAAASHFHVRRDDQHRDAESRPALVVDERRSDRIVEAAPIVPNDDNRRRFPILTLADCIDHAWRPMTGRCLWTKARMVGVLRIGNHPRHRGKLAIRDVREDVRFRRCDICSALALAIADRRNHEKRIPERSDRLLHRCGRVVLPRNRRRLCVEQIAEGCIAAGIREVRSCTETVLYWRGI